MSVPRAVWLGIYAEAVFQQDAAPCKSAGAKLLFSVVIFQTSWTGWTFVTYNEELLLRRLSNITKHMSSANITNTNHTEFLTIETGEFEIIYCELQSTILQHQYGERLECLSFERWSEVLHRHHQLYLAALTLILTLSLTLCLSINRSINQSIIPDTNRNPNPQFVLRCHHYAIVARIWDRRLEFCRMLCLSPLCQWLFSIIHESFGRLWFTTGMPLVGCDHTPVQAPCRSRSRCMNLVHDKSWV